MLTCLFWHGIHAGEPRKVPALELYNRAPGAGSHRRTRNDPLLTGPLRRTRVDDPFALNMQENIQRRRAEGDGSSPSLEGPHRQSHASQAHATVTVATTQSVLYPDASFAILRARDLGCVTLRVAPSTW